MKLEPNILGLCTIDVRKIFYRTKFKFEMFNGQNSNLKICNGQKFEIFNGKILCQIDDLDRKSITHGSWNCVIVVLIRFSYREICI